MKQVVDKGGNLIADLDDENHIVNGHHRVRVHSDMGHELFIKDGDTITPARFETGMVVGSLVGRSR